MRLFSQGLSTAVGYALPIRRERNRTLRGASWVTGPWFLRDERMYLTPGDSPMGFRLPLDSLPWTSEPDESQVVERDPFASRPALPTAAQLRAQYAGQPAAGPGNSDGRSSAAAEGARAQLHGFDQPRAPQRLESASWITRSALCVEPRGGNLYVFLPPLAHLEDFLDLLAAVEATASNVPFASTTGADRLTTL